MAWLSLQRELASLTLIGGSAGSSAQKRCRERNGREQGDSVRLRRLTVWQPSSGRPKSNGSSGRNGAGESKCGSENDSHCHLVQRVGGF